MDLTKRRREFLSLQGWAIQSTQQMTQESISAYLLDRGGSGFGPARIKYYGKEIEVYKVPFSAVEILIDRKTSQGFRFTCYHDEKNDDMWTLWKEERKTVKQEMKKSSKDGVIRKGALQFRQKNPRKK